MLAASPDFSPDPSSGEDVARASACRVETRLDARNSTSRHECRDGSLERLRHKVNSALGTAHGETTSPGLRANG